MQAAPKVHPEAITRLVGCSNGCMDLHLEQHLAGHLPRCMRAWSTPPVPRLPPAACPAGVCGLPRLWDDGGRALCGAGLCDQRRVQVGLLARACLCLNGACCACCVCRACCSRRLSSGSPRSVALPCSKMDRCIQPIRSISNADDAEDVAGALKVRRDGGRAALQGGLLRSASHLACCDCLRLQPVASLSLRLLPLCSHAPQKVLELSWASSTRLLIHIGDAPCHGSRCKCMQAAVVLLQAGQLGGA